MKAALAEGRASVLQAYRPQLTLWGTLGLSASIWARLPLTRAVTLGDSSIPLRANLREG